MLIEEIPMKIIIYLVVYLLIIQPSISQNKSDALLKNKISKEERLIYNMEFELDRSCDPGTNEIPSDIKNKELKFTSGIPTIENSIAMKKQSGNFVMSNPVWKPRGPWNTGGRFLCIDFDVNNENIINAGSASGGMWRSIDRGKSWVKTSDMISVQSVYCLVQDKRKGKTNIWYYGTGEMLSTTDRSVSLRARTMNTGGGIWKSIDNGASWSPLLSTIGGNPAFPDNPFQGVWNIVVDNTEMMDILYASCYGGIYKSEDGGETWKMVLGDKTNPPFSSYIVQNQMGLLFAGISRITLTGKPAQYGIFSSTDDGESWKNITPAGFSDTTRTIKLAVAQSNPYVLYVLAEKPTTGLDPYFFGSSVRSHYFWKYSDSSKNGNWNWSNRSAFLPSNNSGVAALNTLGSYCMTLRVKPDDENYVVIGGTNVYTSSDGFSSLLNTVHKGGYYPQGGYDLENIYCHPDIHGFAFLPSNPKSLFVANDGGIHMTDDITQAKPDWLPLNNGLLGSQFYSIAIDHATPDDPFIFGGLQDNSSQLTFFDDVRKPWPAVIGGDGMATAVANGKEFILGSWYNGSTMSFRFDKDTLDIDYIYQIPDSLVSNGFEFYTLFELDKNDNNFFYIPGMNKLYRKNNMTKSVLDTAFVDKGWRRIAEVPAGNSITALGLSVQPANILYFGTNKGKIYKIGNSIEDRPGYKEITSTKMPANAYCSGICVDPRNANEILVAFSNYHVESIFHSSDGGLTFEPVSGNLEEIPAGVGAGPGVRRVIKVYIGDNPVWFSTTTAGLFSTTKLNGNQTEWVREGAQTIGNVIVDWIDARQDEGYIVIGTQGAGVFSAKYPAVGVEEESKFTMNLGNCTPNPANNMFSLTFTLEQDSFAELNLYDFNGKEIATLASEFFQKGINTVHYDADKLVSGVYFYTLIIDGKRITKRMIVEK
jgi:photosystem II stability/assembly factor-like uncharacterized protein